MHEGNIPARPNGKTEQPPTAPRDRLLSRGAAYTFSLAGPKALQVVTLPFFVYAMSAAEFGRMALAVAVTLAVIPLLTRTLESAVFRSWFALADDHQERRRYVSTAAISLLLLPNALAVLVVLLALPYTTGSDKLPTSYLALALFAGSVVISTTVVPLSVLRAQDRLRDFVRVSLVGPAISVPVSVVAVIGFDLGARGWLAANIIGGLATLPFAAVALRDQWRPGVSRRHLRSLAAWALPSVPHGLAHWTLATSDRIILASWVTLSQLGVYNVGYQFALVLPLLYTAMNNAFSSDYGRAITDTAHRSRLPRLVTYQIFLTVAFGLIISLLAPPLIAVTLPEQFQAAQRIVPWIALGYIFFGLYVHTNEQDRYLGGRRQSQLGSDIDCCDRQRSVEPRLCSRRRDLGRGHHYRRQLPRDARHDVPLCVAISPDARRHRVADCSWRSRRAGPSLRSRGGCEPGRRHTGALLAVGVCTCLRHRDSWGRLACSHASGDGRWTAQRPTTRHVAMPQSGPRAESSQRSGSSARRYIASRRGATTDQS